MGIQDNLKRGTIEMILLTLLSEEDKYGYQLAQDLDERSAGEYQLNEATMYPTLYRLKTNGYLTADRQIVTGKRARVYYHLTKKGHEYLDTLVAEYKKVTESIFIVLDSSEKLKKNKKKEKRK